MSDLHMSDLDLPRHLMERVERRWEVKLQMEAQAWRKRKPQTGRDVVSGVPVIRRKRTRLSPRPTAAA